MNASALRDSVGRIGLRVPRADQSGRPLGSLAVMDRPDRQELILSAVIRIIGRDGLAGVSVRSVAREAGVAHGLVNYYFDDKKGLIEAALRRVEAEDLELLEPDASLTPEAQLRTVLRIIVAARVPDHRVPRATPAAVGAGPSGRGVRCDQRHRPAPVSRPAGPSHRECRLRRESSRCAPSSGRHRHHPERHLAHRPPAHRSGVPHAGRGSMRGDRL